jgi:hypothetical protein
MKKKTTEKSKATEKEENTVVADENGVVHDVEGKEMQTAPPPPSMTKEEVRLEHVKRCNIEIAQVLEKYHCELTADVIISDRGNHPRIVTRALRMENEES